LAEVMNYVCEVRQVVHWNLLVCSFYNWRHSLVMPTTVEPTLFPNPRETSSAIDI
jgi:hypothetical protein